VIRILLVDDHYVVRMGLKAIISSDARLAVVAEADDGAQAIDYYRKHKPDVVLMDLRMPGMSGIEATRGLHREFPEARVVMLTTFDGDEDIHRALEAGARGYLLKNIPGPEFLKALHRVHSGGRYLPEAVAARLAERIPCSDLTVRELEVLQLVEKGLSNREIGEVLGVSENTTKTHLKAILGKLGVTDRTEAVTTALHRGILHLD
jgi:DNA-binding NarL/FixJ family response regulator